MVKYCTKPGKLLPELKNSHQTLFSVTKYPSCLSKKSQKKKTYFAKIETNLA